MDKFLIPPDQNGYSVEDGNEVVSVTLDGGLSRSRRDIIGSASIVSVAWTLDPKNYEYFRMFYNSIAVKGAVPFLMELLMDLPTLTEHVCKFVPKSVSLSENDGLKFVVTATLEVKPLPADDAFNIAYNMILELYGDEWPDFYNEFEHLLNVDFPGSLI